MKELRRVITIVALSLMLAWLSGCGGCNPVPVPTGFSPNEGPETGGTTIQISGDKFDVKNGMSVTIGGQNAASVTTTSKTQITAQTPPGTAGQSVQVVVINKKKPENRATVPGQFTYTDATPPTITSTDPADGTMIEPTLENRQFEDSLNVRSTVSVTFSESIQTQSGTVSVQVESTPASYSKQSGAISGSVTGSGNTVTFTSETPMRAGRKYTATVSNFKDQAGNALASSHTFSFTVGYPNQLTEYIVRKGDTLPIIASRPEVYDQRELWPRLVEANQDDYDFNRNRIYVGERLWVPARGPAWGDSVAARDDIK